MASLDTTRNYNDGEVLVEADLDAFLDDIETFLNVTKINDDNIQNNGITGSTKLLNQSVTESKLASNSVTTLKIADGNVTTAKIADAAVTEAKLAATIPPKLLPSGVIMAYSSTTAPTGWLYCDGSAVSRTTYADLFATIGTTYGSGNGFTTFHLPDFRGRFLRGADNAAGIDPNAATRTAMNSGGNTGDNAGSVQGYATALPASTGFTAVSNGAHTHTVTGASNTGLNGVSSGGTVTTAQQASQTTSSNGAHTHSISGGDSETRPVNAAVHFIIKT